VSDDGSYQCPQCDRIINFPNLPTTIGINDKKLIERVGNKFKHQSILEHINFTFKIRGVSRALLQELSRHRLASPSVESTRYTLKKLKSIKSPNLDILREYLVLTGISTIDTANITQLERLIEILKSEVSNDLVKYSLPEAYKVNLQWTINMRSLQNFLYLRSDKSALWEIRQLARSIYEAVPNEYKYLLVDSMRDT
jgi:thymidylate synthase (FAD)